ncbi:DUF1800 domain-containing protein [Thermoflavifilum thermophilum]|uniref:Uncharacterized conserved protein, DUF1800 family n=1 Tax=Thermoflavifilum thermophilum TaxID=1393122 RepID=A0A1I7N5L5_9BACT|nr:DUF1800 domain-containing protein [Thermoflavifilum thermophilum]SFV29964.1 Uncharacterized conserved protein, DUF1800 family [Thermoflavifilum thermophilum]
MAMHSATEPLWKYQHLAWRAGFGIDRQTLLQWQSMSLKHVVKTLLRQHQSMPTILQTEEGRQLREQLPSLSRRFLQLTADEKKQLQKLQREGVKNLNLAWLQEMSTTPDFLREKMALFWHGHFACRVPNVLHNEQMLQVIRENALGNFGTLLVAVSKSPAMLQFLNNQQNRKQHPNENFAREVMELFTMGRGNYTEQDVKEGARAFTGWGFNAAGEFVFRKNLHDDGVKHFLGRTGRFTGDDILQILLEQRATVYHVTEKLYRFLVNDEPDTEQVQLLANHFYESGYDSAALLERIFTSEHFYAPQNIGAHIKSPVELIVGMQRLIPVTYPNPNIWLLFQRSLEQVLFYPPNVGGWPGGKSWIDSSSLMLRLRLPQVLYAGSVWNIRPKAMPDEIMDEDLQMQPATTSAEEQQHIRDYIMHAIGSRMQGTVQWDGYLQQFHEVAEAQLGEEIAQLLFVNTPQHVDMNRLSKYVDHSSRERLIQSLTIQLMSTPEYQVC